MGGESETAGVGGNGGGDVCSCDGRTEDGDGDVCWGVGRELTVAGGGRREEGVIVEAGRREEEEEEEEEEGVTAEVDGEGVGSVCEVVRGVLLVVDGTVWGENGGW